MMHRTIWTGTILVLTGTLALPLEAQRGPRGSGFRDGGPQVTSVVELALAQRVGLELVDQQVEQLNALRLELLDERIQAMAERMSLQSDLRAGEITAADMREAMEAQRDAMEGGRDEVETRLAEILTEDQLDELSRTGRRGRLGGAVGPRGFGRGGPGMRPGRGFGPGRSGIPGRGFRRVP